MGRGSGSKGERKNSGGPAGKGCNPGGLGGTFTGPRGHAREIGVTCSVVWQLREGTAGRQIPEGWEGCEVGAVGEGRA